MKNRLVVLSIVLFSVVGAFSQQSLGLQIGFVQPNLRENNPLADNSKKLSNTTVLNGGKIGLVYDATLVKGFGFSIGLNYAISGNNGSWKQEEGNDYTGHKIKQKNLLQTIELPIDWQYKIPIAQETYFILYTGPTIQYNFMFNNTQQSKNYKGKVTTDYEGSWYKKNIDADKDSDGNERYDYQPLNILWGIGGGFQYKNYYLRGGYDFGIYLPYKDAYYTTTEDNLRRRGRFDNWSIRLGWYFLNF